VISLLKDMTLKATADLLGISWDTIKDIHVRYLKNKYSPPSLKGVDCIGIDEFAVKKGYVYKTIVVDLKSGRIIYVGNGKGADALKGFWKRVKRNRIDIKYIATDFSSAYTSSIFEDFCSSGQMFAADFFQIPPRDGHPCLSGWTVPTTRVC
jgi:transposase